jgi:hypothetical protein
VSREARTGGRGRPCGRSAAVPAASESEASRSASARPCLTRCAPRAARASPAPLAACIWARARFRRAAPVFHPFPGLFSAPEGVSRPSRRFLGGFQADPEVSRLSRPAEKKGGEIVGAEKAGRLEWQGISPGSRRDLLELCSRCPHRRPEHKEAPSG